MGDVHQYRINLSAPNLVNVCIDNNENGDMSGRMYCCYDKEPVLFSSVIDLIREMENLFDAISFPQASTRTRMFRQNKEGNTGSQIKPAKVVPQEEIIKNTGRMGTFITSVRFRQNSTWQGDMFWVEEETVYRFTDSLEFIRNMDRAVSGLK